MNTKNETVTLKQEEVKMKPQFENRNPKNLLTKISAAFCVIFLAFNAVSFSQLTQQVSFDFTGITTCDNEMIYNVPNLIG